MGNRCSRTEHLSLEIPKIKNREYNQIYKNLKLDIKNQLFYIDGNGIIYMYIYTERESESKVEIRYLEDAWNMIIY